MSATTATTGTAPAITLEDLKRVLASLEPAAIMEQALHNLAERNGFSLKDGDIMLLPAGCDLEIPASLADAVKKHPLVTGEIVLIKGDLLLPRKPV